MWGVHGCTWSGYLRFVDLTLHLDRLLILKWAVLLSGRESDFKLVLLGHVWAKTEASMLREKISRIVESAFTTCGGILFGAREDWAIDHIHMVAFYSGWESSNAGIISYCSVPGCKSYKLRESDILTFETIYYLERLTVLLSLYPTSEMFWNTYFCVMFVQITSVYKCFKQFLWVFFVVWRDWWDMSALFHYIMLHCIMPAFELLTLSVTGKCLPWCAQAKTATAKTKCK